MTIKPGKAILITVLLALVAMLFWFDLTSLVSFANIKAQQQAIDGLFEQHPVAFPLIFFFIYLLLTAVSFPGATVMTLLAGALFGLGLGTIMVSFASTIGATLAFLIARYLFQPFLLQRYGDKLAVINRGIEREGAYYLLGLRLVPLFPFFVINILMGLTTIRTSVYYWVSQLGMLPATLIYVNAGTQLASLESAAGILSPQVIVALAMLGVFPIAAKKLIGLKKPLPRQHDL